MTAWVATVGMGLGHQRATFPLASIAEGGILTLGEPGAGSPGEARMWKRLRGIYDGTSRLESIPLLGRPAFALVDRLQRIPPYYPCRDLSRPTFPVAVMSGFIRRGLCTSLLERLADKPLPLVTSYPALAIAADAAGHEPVYCIVCDADVSRAWVPAEPGSCRIRYLAPCEPAVRRLRSYGVAPERISRTGFPLPVDLLGSRSLEVAGHDFYRRLGRLETAGRAKAGPLTVTFAVGGAGAQREIGRRILEGMRAALRAGCIRLNLVAGVREEVRHYFERSIAALLPDCPSVRVVSGRTTAEYFRQFSLILHSTDVLWTKPSELCFYSALGLPIIVAPPIGSHEVLNRRWLLDSHAGIAQDDPRYCSEWLLDLHRGGRLAEAAWNGFRKGMRQGTFAIQDIVRDAGASIEKRADRRIG